MRGRYRTVALQAVGVAVLAAFVFLTFLRPSDPGDLAGIDALGGGDGQTLIPPPDEDKEKGKKGGNDQNGPGGNDRSDAPQANGIDQRGGSGRDDPEVAGTVPPDDGVGPDYGGPDDDQYEDLVSILMKQVGQPEPFEEIDEP